MNYTPFIRINHWHNIHPLLSNLEAQRLSSYKNLLQKKYSYSKVIHTPHRPVNFYCFFILFDGFCQLFGRAFSCLFHTVSMLYLCFIHAFARLDPFLRAGQQAFGIHNRKAQPENGAFRLRKNTSLLLSFWNTENLRKVLFTT